RWCSAPAGHRTAAARSATPTSAGPPTWPRRWKSWPACTGRASSRAPSCGSGLRRRSRFIVRCPRRSRCSATPRRSPKAVSAFRPQHLPKSVLQDAAVLVVEHFLRRVDADDRLEGTLRAARPPGLDRDGPPGGEAAVERAGQPLDVINFLA